MFNYSTAEDAPICPLLADAISISLLTVENQGLHAPLIMQYGHCVCRQFDMN
jgi:hypothetical protein